MTVEGQAATANEPGPGVPGPKSGQTPGVRQVAPPKPGELPQTPWEIEGPYFRLGAPERANLLQPGDRVELVLTGRVLTPEGRPIAHAVVNFWHCNKAGEYDMAGYNYTGYQFTDADGRYELTTIVPGAYQPREAKHIHVKVQAVTRPVTTQLYFEGEPNNTADEYYHPALFVHCTVDEAGVKHGTFDFVIEQFDEDKNVTPESLAARA
jgi:protocatechuate 3,4-dioxygenase beta subunit